MNRLRISYLILLFLLIRTSVYGQTIDDLSKTVIFLQKESQATEWKSGENFEVWLKNPLNNIFEPKIVKKSGTGFIIRHNGRDYIVTAKHVSKFMDDTSEFLINISAESSVKISLSELRNFAIIKNAKWFVHPQADIAIHPMVYPTKDVPQLAVNESLVPKDEVSVKLLSDAIILGFPLGLGVHKSISPLAKNTQIASHLTTLDYPTIDPRLKFYLLDEALAIGYSGAPVYYYEDTTPIITYKEKPLMYNKKIALIGIISGGLSDYSGGKISLVVPSLYLWDIFNSSEFLKYESQLLK